MWKDWRDSTYTTWTLLTKKKRGVECVNAARIFVPRKFCANLTPEGNISVHIAKTSFMLIQVILTKGGKIVYIDRPEDHLGNVQMLDRRAPHTLNIQGYTHSGKTVGLFKLKSHDLYYRIRGIYIAFFIKSDCCLVAQGPPLGEHH